MSRDVAQNPHEPLGSSPEPPDPPQPHWLELAEERIVHLERRIALASKLVWGILCGAMLGAMFGIKVGDVELGVMLGALTGAGVGRLWHDLETR